MIRKSGSVNQDPQDHYPQIGIRESEFERWHFSIRSLKTGIANIEKPSEAS
jgi:hypothetical protein